MLALLGGEKDNQAQDRSGQGVPAPPDISMIEKRSLR